MEIIAKVTKAITFDFDAKPATTPPVIEFDLSFGICNLDFIIYIQFALANNYYPIPKGLWLLKTLLYPD